MIGAIIGDVVGSIYECKNIKSKEFPLFSPSSHPTDDTVMTLAVSEWLTDTSGSKEDLVKCLQKWGRMYPDVGYGRSFKQWIFDSNPQPYNSWGNGSAMRVSACAEFSCGYNECLKLAEKSAIVTHNHPEGIKGAKATAAAIWLARNGYYISEIKKIITEEFYYDLNLDFNELRKTYTFSSSCQLSVPQGIAAALQAKNFEDAIRNAISIGGDSDTIACIAGSIAEQLFPIPKNIIDITLMYLDNTQLRQIIKHNNVLG